MTTITIEKLRPAIATVVFIIGAFLAVESRYEAKGAALASENNAKIFTLAVEIARLTSTKTIYDAREEAGIKLSALDQNRRDQLIREIETATRATERLQIKQ